jgi:phosphohistidine phosphatase SixA
MNIKKLYLVRHAEYEGDGADPFLSLTGKRMAATLGQKIRHSLGSEESVIWTSSANRAVETAHIIKEQLRRTELVKFDKLWSDKKHPHDFEWLKAQLESCKGVTLIIVSHLEYVQDFPTALGFRKNYAQYTEGVLIENGACEVFS